MVIISSCRFLHSIATQKDTYRRTFGWRSDARLSLAPRTTIYTGLCRSTPWTCSLSPGVDSGNSLSVFVFMRRFMQLSTTTIKSSLITRPQIQILPSFARLNQRLDFNQHASPFSRLTYRVERSSDFPSISLSQIMSIDTQSISSRSTSSAFPSSATSISEGYRSKKGAGFVPPNSRRGGRDFKVVQKQKSDISITPTKKDKSGRGFRRVLGDFVAGRSNTKSSQVDQIEHPSDTPRPKLVNKTSEWVQHEARRSQLRESELKRHEAQLRRRSEMAFETLDDQSFYASVRSLLLSLHTSHVQAEHLDVNRIFTRIPMISLLHLVDITTPALRRRALPFQRFRTSLSCHCTTQWIPLADKARLPVPPPFSSPMPQILLLAVSPLVHLHNSDHSSFLEHSHPILSHPFLSLLSP